MPGTPVVLCSVLALQLTISISLADDLERTRCDKALSRGGPPHVECVVDNLAPEKQPLDLSETVAIGTAFKGPLIEPV